MHRPIAVIDDEPDICELISRTLQKEGFSVQSFSTGDSFLEYLKKEKTVFGLILLDVMLPGRNGMDILRQIRENSDYLNRETPVIFVSARDAEFDRVLGLELGSDDYVVKPFSPRELAARVKAVLRRTNDKDVLVEKNTVIQISGIRINIGQHTVTVDEKETELTAAEFKILITLAKRKGWVFERDHLIDILWGNEKYVTDRTIDVHVKHLREKLVPYGELIKTVRGIGYKIDAGGNQ